jgi:hypothetical protein
MSTDGPQPTQGAPKKTKTKRKVGRLVFGIVFLSLVFFVFFWTPLGFVLVLGRFFSLFGERRAPGARLAALAQAGAQRRSQMHRHRCF